VKRLIPSVLVILPFLSRASGEAASAPAPDMASSLGQMFAALVAVIALLFACLWLMKRLSSPKRNAGLVRIIAAAAVGPRERVVLIEVGGKALLVGVAPGNVRTLHVFEGSELAIVPPPSAAQAPAATFASRLRQALGGTRNAD
jgi:flagellar protein FliO/FliZ